MVCGISILAKLGKGIFFVVVRLREQVPSSNSRLSSEIGHGQMPIAVLCSGLLWAAQGEGAVQELGAVLALGLLSLWLCSSGYGSAEEISSSFGLDECIEIVCGFCAKVNRLIDKSLRQRCCRRRRRRRSSIYAVKTAADCFDNASTPQLQLQCKPAYAWEVVLLPGLADILLSSLSPPFSLCSLVMFFHIFW